MTGKRPKALYVPLSFREELKALSYEEFGRFMRAGMDYAIDGIEPELEGLVKAFFPIYKGIIDRDIEKYQGKCQKNTENINKRWMQEKGGTYDRIRPYTNEYETYQQQQQQQPQQQRQQQPQQQRQQNARAELVQAGYSEAEIERALAGIRPEADISDLISYLRRIMDSNRTKRNPAQNYEQRSYSETDQQREEKVNEVYQRLQREAENERKAQGDSGRK